MKSTKIPKQVLDNLKANGALVEKLQGEGLYSVTSIVYGDKAWKVYENWGSTNQDNIKVGAMFAPSENIMGTIMCPKEYLTHAIQVESNSIIYYASEPEIGPPLLAPRLYVDVSASIALKLMKTIQNPPDNYPTIASLRSGSYICTITHQWSNAGVDIVLFKP